MHISEYKALVAMSQAGASTEQAQTIEDANKAGRNTDNAQMSIKLLMQFMKSPTITDKDLFIYATVLVSLFIIIVFEILGAMIGRDYVYYRNLLQDRGINLNKALELKVLKKRLVAEGKEAQAINAFNLGKAKQDAALYKQSAAVNKQVNSIYAAADKKQGIGFVDTDQVKAGVRGHSPTPQALQMGHAQLLASSMQQQGSNAFVDLGETFDELLTRRNTHAHKRTGSATCPTCLQVFMKPSYQHTYCCPEHGAEFAKILKHLRKQGV